MLGGRRGRGGPRLRERAEQHLGRLGARDAQLAREDEEGHPADAVRRSLGLVGAHLARPLVGGEHALDVGGREARLAAKAGSAAKPALLAALTDGEDFELLFTVTARDAVPLLDAWRKQFPQVPLTCIGKIREGDGVIIRDKHGARPLNVHGYVHFS